ncbi:LysR family transcriptional regulator [Thiohalomonas denitrificans]|uniref:LysR family transcriptional regulator n=1 Tax=Thiohalomonas denitrificans TaxID=415747 RepID=UPI0026EB5B33|nr:LysR family transcriptional regulator [Thiohalomonas denitrificans]
MDRLDALEAFTAVVDAGSFSAAAERLGIAKSAVSRRVTDLESHLGVQLLRRTTRRLSMTEAGRDFHRRATLLLAEWEEATQSVTEGQQTLRGRIRLAAPLSFGLLHLNPALTAFCAEHPGVVPDVDLNDRSISLVDEGFDLAVRIGYLADSTLIARALAPVRMVLCASPEYLARHGTPRTPRELADHQGLVYANVPESQQWRFADRQGHGESVRVPVRLRANNGDLLLDAAVAGLGVLASPTFLAYRVIAEGRLVPLLPDYRLSTAYAYVVYPSRRFVPRRVRVLVDFLLQRFGDHPYWDDGLPMADDVGVPLAR